MDRKNGYYMPIWDADLYLKFANERTQPSLDLISRIAIESPCNIIDLGCGPGNSTNMLRQRWPDAHIVGLDSSKEMITSASAAYPEENWILEDAASWIADASYDIVFSNAALQWLPDHASLFAHLFEQVAKSGALAVQIPAHYQSPFHQAMLKVADNGTWSDRMEEARNALTGESASFYYDVLSPLASRLFIWETEYCHIMDSSQSILNWFKGTGLRPFLEALESDKEKQLFEEMLLDRCMQAYNPQKDGRVLFPFRRLFIIAYR
jgi:trans-aconitate 2-methyltransferase